MKKWLIRLSVVINLLILTIVGVVWLKKDSWTRDKFMRPSQDRWVSQFEVLPIAAGDIVFLGDSITEGGAWEELFPGLPVRNRGIGGDVTEGVLQRLHQVTEGKPAKLFLLIGTNDLGLSNGSPETIADNIDRIVDTLRNDSPETQLYVQSVLPRDASYRQQIESLNGLVQTRIAGKATWIDLYPLFLDANDGSIRNDLSNDELHLLGAGYLLWRETIAAYVSQ